MGKEICFMYSGQGSQYYQMAQSLYNEDSVFRNWMDYLDELVIEKCGYSVTEELYFQERGLSTPFENIRFTNPAIFMVEYALTMHLESMGMKEQYVLGASLGEIVSLTVAGCISAEKMLEFILDMAEILASYGDNGGMITILDTCSSYAGSDILKDLNVAAVNHEKHFVVSGRKAEIQKAENILKADRVPYMSLPVSYGFHSYAIDEIKERMEELEKRFVLEEPAIPVYSCEMGHIRDDFSSGVLWNIVRNCMNLKDVVHNSPELNQMILIDVGPSGTMAGLVKNNMKNNQIYSIISPFKMEKRNLEQLAHSLK